MSKVFFGGRQLITPASASIIDDSAMYNRGAGTGNVAALIGRANGGKPLTVLYFGSAEEARAALKGDDILLKAIEKAFDPSSETGVPSKLAFVRVNPATQAALVLKDGANTAAINLKSTDYGRPNNQIKVKVESGSIAGKKLTTQLGNNYASADNVARNAFSVRYAGAEATATVTVATDAVTLAYGANTAALDLNDFPTVQELVDRINTVPGFTANVLDGSGTQPALNGLDFAANADAKGALVVVTAHLQACIDWLNSAGEGFVTAERAVGAGAVPANIAFTYLSGASDGVVTNAEWQAAFDELKKADVQWIAPLSPLPAVWAMASAHCAFVSGTTKRFRRAFTGGDIGIADTVAMDAARVLNAERVAHAHLGIYDYNGQNKLTLYPAYVTAALLAGMAAGVTPGTPLTGKSIKVQGVERELSVPTDTDLLLQAGVLPLENDNGTVKVVQSITTYTSGDEYTRTEVSVGAGADFVRRSVQEAVDGVRGGKLGPLALQDALARAEGALKAAAVPEPMGPGVLVGDEANPPYRKLRGYIEGTAIKVQYEASIVLPANYVLQTVSAVPYSGTASA
jgi:hypothetical protein